MRHVGRLFAALAVVDVAWLIAWLILAPNDTAAIAMLAAATICAAGAYWLFYD